MDRAALRERNRRRRNKKSGLNLKFFTDFLYFAAIVLIVIGWAMKLPPLYFIAGLALFLGTAYYIFACVKALKANPKKSPEYRDALRALIFYSLMACVSVLAVIFGGLAL